MSSKVTTTSTESSNTPTAPPSGKGKGKAAGETKSQIEIEETEDDSDDDDDDDENGDVIKPDEIEEDDLNTIDPNNILNGHRTRGVKIDFTKRSQDMDMDDEDEDDDEYIPKDEDREGGYDKMDED